MMNIQEWNPDFMNLSQIFLPLKLCNQYVKNMQDWPELLHLNQMKIQRRIQIETKSGKEIHFVPAMPGRKFSEEKYESTVYVTGQVPTRVRNWHDFFNALVWQIFPRAKSALNQLHYQMILIESLNKVKHRSELRDAATHIDESGVIVVSSKKHLIQLLRNFEWKQLFWNERDATLASMRFFVIGHGLYEKSLRPYIGMTGKGLLFDVNDTFFRLNLPDQLQYVDSMLERFILKSLSSNSDLTPIPLLGYPGWTEENTQEAYYDNKKYFRDRRNSIL